MCICTQKHTHIHTNFYTHIHVSSCTRWQGLGCIRLTKHHWRAHYIMSWYEDIIKAMPGTQEPSQTPPVCPPTPPGRLFPTSKAPWEGCPSAAYMSLHEVQRGLRLPADIQLKSFIFPSFALPPWLCRRSCCHLIIILNIPSIRGGSIY